MLCRQCKTVLIHTHQGLQCPVCESARPYVNQAPFPSATSPSYPASAYQSQPKPTIPCQNCSFPTRTASEICSNCGFNPQRTAPVAGQASPTVTEQLCNSCGQVARPGHYCVTSSGSSVWKCRCGYEYNLTQSCLKCGNLNPASCPTVQRTNGYRLIEVNCKVRMNGENWVCEECGFDHNFTRFTQCKVCRAANAIGKQLKDQ